MLCFFSFVCSQEDGPLAIFPDPGLNFPDLRRLRVLRDVQQLIESQECYLFNDEGGIDTKYPRLPHFSGEAKTCSVCGLLGHNKRRHFDDLCVVEEAIRHGTSILRNSMTISPRELTRQLLALLASLVVMSRVGDEDPQRVILEGISKIYTVYNSILHWVTNPSHPQSKYIRRTATWGDSVSMVGEVFDPIKVVFRTTDTVASRWIKKVAERSDADVHDDIFRVTPPDRLDKTKTTLILMVDVDGAIPIRGRKSRTSSSSPDRESSLSRQINEMNEISMNNADLGHRLERMKDGHRYRCLDKETIYRFEHKRRKKTLDMARHDPEHRCKDCGAPTDVSFVGDLDPIVPFSSCQLCNLIGHNQADCRNTNIGTRICLALATILDESKTHRIHPTTSRGTLLNVMLLLVSLQYHVMKDPSSEEDLCSIRIGRGHEGFGFQTDHLVGLLRLYNATVVHLHERLDLQRTVNFSHVSPGAIMDWYIESGVRQASSVSHKIVRMDIPVIQPPSPRRTIVQSTSPPPTRRQLEIGSPPRRPEKRARTASSPVIQTPIPSTPRHQRSTLSSIFVRGAFTNPMSASMTTFRGVLLSAVAQGNISEDDQRDIVARMSTPFLGMSTFNDMDMFA